jgi:hypothetical protein
MLGKRFDLRLEDLRLPAGRQDFRMNFKKKILLPDRKSVV